MRKLAIAAVLAASFMPAQAFAGACGEQPTLPALFDPASASKSDVLASKAKFEAFKQANTTYVECLRDRGSSLRGQRQIDATIRAEQDFAKQFNSNAKNWIKSQKS